MLNACWKNPEIIIINSFNLLINFLKDSTHSSNRNNVLEGITGWSEVTVMHGMAAYLNSLTSWGSFPPAELLAYTCSYLENTLGPED